MLDNECCIITVTQGDFLYIKEWIEYHHNLGVKLFLIGYNGLKKDFNKLPQYDYVRYFDFSKDENKIYDYLDCLKSKESFSSFCNTYENALKDKRILPIQSKILNILLDIVLLCYPCIKYSIIIDTDEFIDIKNNDYKNIQKFLLDNFPDHNSSWSMQMEFYTDNNYIYYEDKPCIERFTEKSEGINYNSIGIWVTKIIINMKHIDTIYGKCFMISSHHCGLSYPNKFIFNSSEIALKHFFNKTLEEWIMKMSTDYDSDYFRRFNKNIFEHFFYGGSKNKITEEKIKAIPELLKKYNINYDPGKDENNEEFRNLYNRINGQS